MARRHFNLTVTFDIDEDLARDNEPDLEDRLDILRTSLHHDVGRVLHRYLPELDGPTVRNVGITYI